MAPIKLTNPIIPPGSLILVTGANGLIASHIVDVLLAAGYSVRGTVRNLTKSSWMTPLFESRHGPGRFELIQVADLAEPGIWPPAVDGVAGIITVAAGADLTSTKPVDEAVQEEVDGFYALLDAASKTGTVKSVVYTSSVWAAWDPQPGFAVVITEKTFNDDACRIAASTSIPAEQKGIKPFMAIKVKVELALWDWVDEHKPAFRFNAVLPDTIIGPILCPDKQSASTAGFVRGLWNSDPRSLAIIEHIAPQWLIDPRDNARLYLAALTTPGVDRERLFGCAEKFSFPQIARLLKELYPEKEGLPELEDAGWDESEVPVLRPLELLRSVGQEEWTPLVQSLRDTIESFEGKKTS
ncbi:NAD(P)-binding protein [Coniochaeta ligniaria NRRL 30616]|uniref:NAD(P)-binding protein n=1 Tax=Coniochaeta ligniaria NRRL 30616 TaxID=1408157 RepID=A0A1J7J4G0_9PEZI|nr:NAD(P)-binding protein [Coniochaeta ligniaria NRRL 30616]